MNICVDKFCHQTLFGVLPLSTWYIYDNNWWNSKNWEDICKVRFNFIKIGRNEICNLAKKSKFILKTRQNLSNHIYWTQFTFEQISLHIKFFVVIFHAKCQFLKTKNLIILTSLSFIRNQILNISLSNPYSSNNHCGSKGALDSLNLWNTYFLKYLLKIDTELFCFKLENNYQWAYPLWGGVNIWFLKKSRF